MKIILKVFLELGAGVSVGSLSAWGQGSDLNLPKQREAIISEARALLERRPVIYDDKADPFVLLAPEVPESMPSGEKKVDPVESAFTGVELLKNLANQVPATGTAMLGGQYYLLTGQKRLKVGDRITINFQGGAYDIEILSISATNFSVKRGDATHTRAVRLSN